MKFLCWNLENFFISNPGDDLYPNEKSAIRIKKMASIVKEISPDILMLSEVGGVDSLKNFNHQYLGEQYFQSLIPGNSDREIHLGFMVKKGLPLTFEHYTHRNRPLDFKYPHEKELKDTAPHYMSRDIAELRILKEGKIQFIILLVHLKSKLDKDGIDFNGTLRRKAECDLLVKTYLILNKRYQGKVPILLGGDFNGNASEVETDPEFLSIYQETELRDFLTALPLRNEDRYTFFSRDRDKNIFGSQLDYLFIPPELFKRIDLKNSGIFHFKDDQGTPLPLPTQVHQLYGRASDHLPLVLTLKD